MADTTSSNGAKSNGPAGGTPLTGPGGATGGSDPIVGAEAGLTQTETALKPALDAPITADVRKHTPRLGKKREGQIEPWLRLGIRRPELAPGVDLKKLPDELALVERIKGLIPRLHGLTRNMEDTVLVRLSDLWTVVSNLFNVALHMQADAETAQLIAQMQSALSPGPRKQKTVQATITPIPKGKKALKAAALSHAHVVHVPAGTAPTVTPSEPAPPAPAGTVPASEAPASNSNSGT